MDTCRDVAKRVVGNANDVHGVAAKVKQTLMMTGKFSCQSMKGRIRKLAQKARFALSDVPKAAAEAIRETWTYSSQKGVDVVELLLEPVHAAAMRT